MKTYQESRDRLVDLFNAYGWPFGLNYDKLCYRSTLAKEQNEPDGWTVIEIERHRAFMGQYTPGAAMSAYETYWQRYAVHPEIDEIKELPERHGDISIDASDVAYEEVDRLLEISIEPVSKEKYRIWYIGGKAIVSSLKEAISFMTGQPAENSYEYFKMMLEMVPNITDEDMEEKLSTFRESWEKAVARKVEELWERADVWEDMMNDC